MGICHRDLKPDNILVDPSNKYTIKVIDFGISRKFQSRDPCNKYIIITHNMWSRTGTLCYKSPEMFSSAAYNESCDMWSVAVIAYELLTGKLPFYQEYQTDTIEQIENCQYTFDDVGNFKWKDNKYAKDFIKRILKVVENKSKRLTASEALVHPWLQDKQASKVVKDDVHLKNTQFKVPEMGKSTDVLMQLHSTYVKKKKSANNINPSPSQVSNSGMQLSTLKASYMGSNNMLMGSRINQGNQYMTTSQIQLLRGDDIHVIKQTGFNFGGFHQNNSEVSNAGNGLKITLPDISMRKVKNNIRANQEQAESGMQTPMFQKEQHDYMGKGDEQIHIKKGSEDEYQNMLGSRQPSQSICYADYTQYQQQATNSGNNSQEQEQNPQQSAFLLTKYNPSEQMCISRSEVDEPDSMKFLIPSQSIKCSLDNSQALHMSQLQKSLTKSNDSGIGAGIGGLTQDEEWFNAEIRASKSIGLTSSNIKEQFPNEEHIIEEEENEEVITTPGNLTLRNEQFFTSMKSNQYSDDMETPSFTNKNQQSNLIQQQQIKITKRKESDQSNNSGKQISSFQNKSKKQSEDSLEGFEDLHLKGAKSNLVENPYYDIQPPLLQVNSDKTNQSNLQQNQTRSPYQNLNNCTSPSFQETN